MDQVSSGDDGLSVLEFYSTHYRRADMGEWPRRIETGLITRAGEVLRSTDPVRAGDRLEYHRLPWQEPEVPLDAPVLYTDEDLVVFNKPAGLPVTPGAGCLERTLLHLARAAFGPALNPAHRLDTGTSGAVAFTRNPETARHLHQTFLRGKIRKVYRARVVGTDLPDRFHVDLPMGRVPYPPLGDVSGVVAQGGRHALTEVAVVWRDTGAGESVVEVRPRTGRSQQIRAHLAWAGWPLVGDRLYGPGGLRWPLPPEEAPSRPGEGGFLLHAWSLDLPRRDGTTTTVEAPLPEELRVRRAQEHRGAEKS
ncbi:MAG: pseudouridine synthase [Pseudomonadota bacterium]